MTSQKSRRCYHRVISGLQRSGQYRFLTLTSSNTSPDLAQKDWRALYMRLKRRGLIDAYIKVPEPSRNGKQHLHIIFRGQYIAQAVISAYWLEIHHAKVVDIRRIKQNTSRRQLASYLAKYMSKDNLYRYSWSWSWVWKGFCKSWDHLKKVLSRYNDFAGAVDFKTVIAIWDGFVKLKTPRPLERYLRHLVDLLWSGESIPKPLLQYT